MKWTEFAVREARQTLIEWEQRYDKLEPPIPVEDIADLLYSLAIDITDDLPSGTAGRLYVEDRIIAARKSDANVRQRFTIAHEIGHYRLHVVAEGLLTTDHTCSGDSIGDLVITEHSFLVELESSDPNIAHNSTIVNPKRLEIEANRFAAEVLMPATLIEATVAYRGADITSLAELFDVSFQAMRFRLEKLLFLPPSGPQSSLLIDL